MEKKKSNSKKAVKRVPNNSTENELDKQADMQFFYSNEYFGVKKNIIKP